MSDDTTATSPGPADSEGFDHREKIYAARWVIAMAIVLAALGVVSGHVSILAAAVAIVAVLVAVMLSARRPAIRARHAAQGAAGAALWPDTGMKMVVDALPDPCFIVDRRGITRYANRAARERFGKVRPGDPISFRLRPPALLEALDRVIADGGTERIEWSEKVPTERWLEAHIGPVQTVEDGREKGARRADGFILVAVRDLTEQRRLERMRADFVANASHELRTPLASLTGFIETLQGPAREDKDARERFLGIMLEQAGRMRRLIDDLLSLSRIELRAHVRPQAEIDLGSVIRDTVQALEPLAAKLDVEIRTDLPQKPLTILGDRDEMAEVFQNIVENALKYGASGKYIDISVYSEIGPQNAPWWAVKVKDYGPGIEAAHLPRLTERFYRVDVATSREMKGTGLGLAIVKHILTRHRARLDIESTVGEGACFYVRIPAVVRELANV
ncbi:PAS domain-containing protein [Stappia sp. F7233]|uniref:histidine kinase n=1 Tax=Stappia albiluteola TaxID=2758565 RepID=A0A839AJK9_9HYPH|nr:ATP-binding protein [Stappia albiluteola]MBA5779218.1 PAS domain-containing protein [Stappia albiluteola]